MKLNNYLSKFFYVEESEVEDDNGNVMPSIWLYAHEDDSEPVVILKHAGKPGEWLVGNISSSLQHDTLLSEQQIKKMAKAGMITY
ncbi:hypothetical protein HA43_14705 [Pantoea eucrina]|nr:hypothetical protein HA43_14705 [Pantoea eucrina]